MDVSSYSWFMFAVLLTIVGQSTGATPSRILGVFPMAGKSHMTAFNTLMVALSERGHEVTIISPYPTKTKNKNLKEILSPNILEDAKSDSDTLNMVNMKNHGVVQTFQHLLNFSAVTCEKTMQIPEVQNIMKSTRHFDVIFISVFFNDCFLGFVHKFKSPLILISPGGSFPWIDDAVGNPYPYSYVPGIFTNGNDHLSFTQRFTNMALSEIVRYIYDIYVIPKAQVLAKKHFGEDVPPLYNLLKNASMLFLNNHIAFSYPRPMVPSIVEIGGMHCKPAKPLPEDIKKFVDGSGNDGFIFFSMGSNLRSQDFPKAQLESLVKAFSKLKQRVLWKWELDELPGKPKNVMIGKWLPQQDILGHPKIRAFITHGGLLSTQETVYHGVPVIGIPIYGDQEMNMQKAVTAGYGLRLNLEHITEESVLAAVNEVISNPSYRQIVEQRKVIMRDQPEDPLHRAVYWTEYVIRHKGARHLRSAALDLSWYQLYLLDVIAVTILVLAAVIAIALGLIRCLCRAVCCGTKSKSKKE